MKLKSKKSLILPLVALLAAGVATGCGGSGKDDNKLRIVVLNAGYGDTWIKELEKKFEDNNPDIDVDINALYEANNLIKSHLESRKNKDDIYISVGTDWKSYAAQGYFASLDDLLEETVDGVTVKEKVADEYEGSLYFTKSDGSQHCYRLPWTSGIGGIYYNKYLFEQNGWSIPQTFEQLLDLCNTIIDAKIPVPGDDGTTAIKPFAYTGANTDYFDYTVFDWWAQIVGVDAIKEFLKYESYENYDVTKNETYAALKTASSYWQQLFISENGKGESKYVISESQDKPAEDAQKEFLNGHAAMMFNGDWLYNEIINYGVNTDTFELGLMKTPVVPEAKAEFANTSYVIGEDQYIVIPKTSKKKDVAKEFIKLMISNEGSSIFTKHANGFLAYDTDFSNAGIENKFIQETIALRNSYTNKFTNYSSNRKYLCNFIDVWCTGGSRPYLGLLNGTSDLNTSFELIASTSKGQWSKWTQDSR